MIKNTIHYSKKRINLWSEIKINPINTIKNTHPMNVKHPKNYDVIVAFVVFIFCILYALFSNVAHVAPTVVSVY